MKYLLYKDALSSMVDVKFKTKMPYHAVSPAQTASSFSMQTQEVGQS